MVSEEEFEAWRDHPVTQWVFAACRKAAADQQRQWIETSWTYGQSNPSLLIELRTRADAYEALADTDHAAWVATHEGDEQ